MPKGSHGVQMGLVLKTLRPHDVFNTVEDNLERPLKCQTDVLGYEEKKSFETRSLATPNSMLEGDGNV